MEEKSIMHNIQIAQTRNLTRAPLEICFQHFKIPLHIIWVGFLNDMIIEMSQISILIG